MKELKQIVFFKENNTIQLRGAGGEVLRQCGDHGDDKIVCDLNGLRAVTDVLARLGCTMDARTNINAPAEPAWVLYRREGIPKTAEHEMLATFCAELAGIKVFLEQGKVEEARQIVAATYEQVRDYISGVADAEDTEP